MKITSLILCFILCTAVIGQTENHKPVAGTKYSLVPPAGFVASSSFSGFMNKDLGASIVVTEVPAPVQTISDGFTADVLKSRGMILIDKQNVDFNNSKAVFIKLSQEANGITYLKQMLIFGDSKKTVLLTGVYPEKHKSIEGDIKAALLSTSYNENQNDNPLDAASFKIDVSGSEFKVAKYIAGSLLYTFDGKIPTERPTLLVGNSLSKVSVEDKKQYCIDRFNNIPDGKENKIKEINPVQIDGMQGYELIANRKKDTKDELVYQVMLFTTTDDYFIILGSTTENPDAMLLTFKNIAKTFKRK
ncbi:MAG: hypothetical protein ABIR18_10670 [Chitinophagaceae bacterium]